MDDIIFELTKIKGTSSARLVLLMIHLYGCGDVKITKKLCRDWFTGEPSKANNAIKILSESNIIDFKKWEMGEPNWDYFTTMQVEPTTPLEKFSYKYGRKFLSAFKSYWNILVKIASSKRYFPEEYFNLLIAEARKDKFWSTVITEEMCMRKVDMMEKNFGSKIPKKVGDMWDVSSIF